MATSHVFTKFADALGQKTVDMDSDTFKVMLLSAYTPAQDTHKFVSDVLGAGTEASGTGYTTGGQTLSSLSWTQSAHVYTWTFANPSWTTTGGSLAAAYAIFFDSTPGSNATNPVACYWDFGGTQTSANGTFTLTMNGSGLLTVTGS